MQVCYCLNLFIATVTLNLNRDLNSEFKIHYWQPNIQNLNIF